MITDKSEDLTRWLKSVQKDLSIKYGLPDWSLTTLPSKPSARIHPYLVEQAPQRATINSSLNSYNIYFLITFSHLESFDSALRSASENQFEFSLDMQSKPAEFWQALNIAPQAALFLRSTIDVELTQPSAPRITQHMKVRYEPVSSMTGYVLGPNKNGLLRAEVKNLSTGEVCKTDRRGQFVLRAVPDSNTDFQLAIHFKGRELTQVQASLLKSEQPLKINITAKEMENAYV